jgi:Reverse transcriptase (RNA-dependent DNA polymerase)/Endonuclease-reverse transcriptase
MDPREYSKLKIMTWNANSILPKKHEFFDFVLRNEIDVALINETYLKQGTPFSHPDFRCYRLDREGRVNKGGVAILVRSNLPHNLLPSFQTKILECIGISVNSATGPINFISTYRPGGRSTADDIAKFRSDINLLTSSRTSFFICGDLNARHSSWGCSRANAAGDVLFECSGDFAVYYPPSHTRIPLNRRQRPSTLDIVLSNGLHEIENISTRIELSSDHLPVLFEVCSDSRREIPDHFIFNYKHADWNQFKLILDSRIDLDFSLDRIDNESQIDLMIDTFTTVLLEARSESVPKISPFRFSLVLTEEIKSKITRRNTLRRRAQRTSNSEDIRRYRALNSIVGDACNELQNDSFGHKLSKIRPNHKSLFSFTKLIKNKCRGVPALKIDGVTLLTGPEKANAIAAVFSRAHNNTMPSPLEIIVDEGCSILQNNVVNSNPSNLTSPRELKKIIKNLKNSKAPGFDNIPNILLKNLSRKALVFLTYIFNSCLKLCYFPKIWKHAIVIPIPKPGKDLTNPSSYRPISLLSSISKIFERVILKRLNDFISSNNVLPNHQFGFRRAHSAAHQLRRVVRNVKNARNAIARGTSRVSQSTGMLLLDVEKAFDSVWHEALLHKLLQKGCDIFLAKLIFSFLKGRSFQVTVGNSKSITHDIPYGVPQGAILSPTLYNIFTSDVPTSEFCNTATFADDTAIFASGPTPLLVQEQLQEHLNSISDYCKDWKIKINASKTQAIYFSRNTVNIPRTEITLDGDGIPWSGEVKYLGVHLDKRLTFASHISKSIDKATLAFRILYSFLNRKSKLCVPNKLLLYKVCIRPILCYGVECWYDCAATHRRKLQIIQNKQLKIIMNRHWRYSTAALHEETGIPLIEEFGNRITERFFHKTRFSENPLILGLNDS